MRIKRSLVCAMVVGIVLPLAAPASAIGGRARVLSGDGVYGAVAASPSWSLASWLGRLLTSIWGHERGYIDPGGPGTNSVAPGGFADLTPTS